MENRSMDDCRRRFFDALKESDFPDEVVKAVEESWARTIEAFLGKSENRGPTGRRAKKEPVSRAKTIKHLKNAVRHAGHDDPTIRKEAKALIRSAQHLPFEKLEKSASRFHGRVMRAGRNREERKRRERRRRFPLREDEWVEVNSSRQLESVGRELGNCCAHKRGLGQEYHEDLKNESAEFWVYRKNGTAIWLLQIDRETRTVSECEGRKAESPKLKRKKALELLRKLKVTADDCDSFSAIGAYSIFVTGSPEGRTFPFDGREVQVWCSPGERDRVVIRIGDEHNLFERKPRRAVPRRRASLAERRAAPCRRASLAEWSPVSWHDGAMTEGQFIDLLLYCPEVAERIRAMFPRDWGSDEP